MEIRIKFPSAFRLKRGTSSEIAAELSGGCDTVLDVLDWLDERYPELREDLRGEDGRVRLNVQIYVNEEHVRYRQGLQTPLQDGDWIYIVPMVMGG